MSPDFKGIKSLRLEDFIPHLCITLYNVSVFTLMIDSYIYIYRLVFFYLSRNTQTMKACHSKLQESLFIWSHLCL